MWPLSPSGSGGDSEESPPLHILPSCNCWHPTASREATPKLRRDQPATVIAGVYPVFVEAHNPFSRNRSQFPHPAIVAEGQRQEDFPWIQAGRLSDDRIDSFQFRYLEFSGGQIETGKTPGRATVAGKRQEIIVFLWRKVIPVHNKARGNNSNHLPADNTFCRPGIFNLFADGDYFTRFNEFAM